MIVELAPLDDLIATLNGALHIGVASPIHVFSRMLRAGEALICHKWGFDLGMVSLYMLQIGQLGRWSETGAVTEEDTQPR